MSQFVNLFPLWVLLSCVSGLTNPSWYTAWYNPSYVTAMLAATMLCMGFTLSLEDITNVLKNPVRVVVGAVLQYTIMPSLGFVLSRLPGMSPPFAAGIILVACCPGGTASNIITYLAKADVGLSVMMTTARSATSLQNQSCSSSRKPLAPTFIQDRELVKCSLYIILSGWPWLNCDLLWMGQPMQPWRIGRGLHDLMSITLAAVHWQQW
jgi:hypothetical protein